MRARAKGPVVGKQNVGYKGKTEDGVKIMEKVLALVLISGTFLEWSGSVDWSK